MTYRLRPLLRERTFHVADAIEHDGRSERVVIIEPMTPVWIEEIAPTWVAQAETLFDNSYEPTPDAFRLLMANKI